MTAKTLLYPYAKEIESERKAYRPDSFSVKELPVSKYTQNSDIVSICIRRAGRSTTYVINYSESFDAKQWSLTDAIAYYSSPEGELERDISFRRAWGFYD